MKKIILISLFGLMSLLYPNEKYVVTELSDGSYTFKGEYGGVYNKGSSLNKKAFILNDGSCPVQIDKVSVNFYYASSSFNFKCTTDFKAKKNIAAVQVIHILYDIFGIHMKNLSNQEVKDFTMGSHTIEGAWRSYGNEVSEFLNSATYVKRVLFTDGTVWEFNEENLLQTLSSLNLENKIDDKDD